MLRGLSSANNSLNKAVIRTKIAGGNGEKGSGTQESSIMHSSYKSKVRLSR